MIKWRNLSDEDFFLYRTPEIEKNYFNYKDTITKKYGSLYKYILDYVLIDKTKDYHLTFNDYPYHLEDGVLHFLIWDLKKGEPNRNEYKKFVYKYFHPKYYDIIIRINKPNWRSIPEIKHCHLFIKLKDNKL